MPGTYAVCRLKPDAVLPAWAQGPFVSITYTEEELSIVCPAEKVPVDVTAERNWRMLKLVGPFPFSVTGVLAAFAAPLAKAGISLLSIATYDTDYFFVKGDVFDDAIAALRAAGHVKVR